MTKMKPTAYAFAIASSTMACGRTPDSSVRRTAMSSTLKPMSSPAESPDMNSPGPGRSSSWSPWKISSSRTVP